jgi:hypothetical protein
MVADPDSLGPSTPGRLAVEMALAQLAQDGRMEEGGGGEALSPRTLTLTYRPGDWLAYGHLLRKQPFKADQLMQVNADAVTTSRTRSRRRSASHHSPHCRIEPYLDQGGALCAPRAGTGARPPAWGRPRPARAGPTP